jgi:predicted metal-binding protein
MKCCALPKNVVRPHDGRGMIRIAKSRWTGVVLVCGKCSRKIDGGFGADGGTPLAKALSKRVGKGRKATHGVIETKCLKLCPKRAVAVVDAGCPDRWLVVDAGEPVDTVAARIGLAPADQA